MIINYPAISRLAWLDSTNFDKEGFLFVRERREGLFNQWKSETFIERLCRLRGNLLFILATTSYPHVKRSTSTPTDKIQPSKPSSTSNVTHSTLFQTESSQPSIGRSASSSVDLLTEKDSLQPIGENRIVFILFLEECIVKLSEESNSKHFSFIIEFGKNDSTKPFHFTTISQQERDSWVESIHLSSLTYLKSLHKTFLNLKLSGTHRTVLASHSSSEPSFPDSPHTSSSSSPTPTQTVTSTIMKQGLTGSSSSSSFVKLNLSCTIVLADDHPLKPNLFIAVYYRKERFTDWLYLDRTEIVSSQSAKFAKQFNLPSSDWSLYHLRFKIFDVIERLTETRVLLGESVYTSSTMTISEKNQDSSPQQSIIDLNITSTLRDSQVIGKLRVIVKLPLSQETVNKSSTQSPVNQQQPSSRIRPNSLPIPSIATQSTSTIRTTIGSNDQNNIASFSSSSEGVTMNQITEHPCEAETGREQIAGEKGDPERVATTTTTTHLESIVQMNEKLSPENGLSRRFSCPNNLEVTLGPTTNSSANPSPSPVHWDLDDDLFVNSVYRSFQFDLPLRGISISVEEIMAETKYCMLFPQIIMNMFMDDEKKLMNCATYSLGEVKPDYQRAQMRVLESHLRLVNVVTETINELNQIQCDMRYFRPSIAKEELHFQYVPLNFHLQRCLVNNAEGRSENKRRSTIASPTFEKVPSSPGQIIGSCLSNTLDVYSVGAFATHYLGFDSENLNLNNLYPLTNSSKGVSLTTSSSSTHNSSRNVHSSSPANHPMDDLMKNNPCSPVYMAWKSMKNYLLISSLVQLIDVSLRKLMFYIEDGLSASEKLKTLYETIDSNARRLINILDPREVEETLQSLEIFKTHPSSAAVTTNSSINKSADGLSINYPMAFKLTTADCSINEIKATAFSKRPNCNDNSSSTGSNLTSEELEPVDLIYLNIKASLISISSKINHSLSISKFSRSEVEPSKLKLTSANAALLRIASICYAIETIKLEREKLELFYTLRLKRGMLFSQILTSLITSVINQLKLESFQRSLVSTRSITAYFQSLLSCYASEIGMLNDMASAVQEVNSCVTFVFINFKDPNRLNLDLPRIEGNGHNVRVIIAHSSAILPDYLEAQPQSFLFNIGINEQATLAETFGHVKLQETINQNSFHRLEDYVRSIELRDDPHLHDLMTGLRIEIWSRRAKNVRILHLMENVCYLLNGIRFTSCKSAKDRTSMAITLEEVRLCSRKYLFNEIEDSTLFQQMLDTLRSEGTRRENTRKNIGVAKYAFNSLQAMTLPKLYRPPSGTYSNVRD